MSLASLVLMQTAVLLVVLMLLGLSLQLGWRRDQARWPHHALYFLATGGLGTTLFLLWREGKPVWVLGPTFLLLLSMPLTRPGKADHWQRALLVALTFFLGAWAVLH